MLVTWTPAIITILLALLLTALIMALIFSPGFRDAVLGSPGEAKILNLLTVKGVAIVLLSALLLAGLLLSLEKMLQNLHTGATSGPITMRLNVHFLPDEVNPRNPMFIAKAFLKTSKGNEPLPLIHKLNEGALSVQVTVPDMATPFFIVFETPKGIWQTDDFSVQETGATAKLNQE
jgi:hypothetical protein